MEVPDVTTPARRAAARRVTTEEETMPTPAGQDPATVETLRAVWSAVDQGDRRGTNEAVLWELVYPRTGTRVTAAQCHQAVERLIQGGHLYRNYLPTRTLLLPGPAPGVGDGPGHDEPPAGLFEVEL